MQLNLLTQQVAAFDRVAEHKRAQQHDDWDAALRSWISNENRARARNANRYDTDVVYLPQPLSSIDPGNSFHH